MKIEVGELITLSNNKEYVCFGTASDNGIDYVYLMSNFKPLEIKFGEQTIVDGQIQVRIINNQEEKEKVLTLFEQNNVNINQ